MGKPNEVSYRTQGQQPPLRTSISLTEGNSPSQPKPQDNKLAGSPLACTA